MENSTPRTDLSDTTSYDFDLFLSYASLDRNVVVGGKRIDVIRLLKRTLERHVKRDADDQVRRRPFRVCTDTEDFELDDNVRLSIRAKLMQCSGLLVVCSEAATTSEYVNYELECFSIHRPEKRPLAAALTMLPAAAFPHHFDRESMAANLQPQPNTSATAWRTQLVNESHKIVAAVWDVPLQQVYDRFEAERKRRRRLATPIILLFVLLFGSAASFAVWKSVQVARFQQRDDLLSEIDNKQQELQKAIDEANQTPNGVRAHLPLIRPLADELRELLVKFNAEFRDEVLPDEIHRQIRDAEGTVLISEREFAKALEVVTQEDEEAAGKDYLRRLRIRASAFYGLRQWNNALERFRKILANYPNDSFAKNAVGVCLVELGEIRAGFETFDELVRSHTSVTEQGDWRERADLATTLSNRGNALSRLQRHTEAVRDYNKAVAIRMHLVEQEGHRELASELSAALVNRGQALHSLKKFVECVQDYNKAIDLYTRMVEQEGRKELTEDLALSFTNRGNVRSDLQDFADALKDYDNAVVIRTRLLQQDGHMELADELAASLNNRGVALRTVNSLPEALRDFNQAIGIHRPLVEQEGRLELTESLARGIYNRALTLSDLQQPTKAVDGFNESVDLLTRLVEQDGRDQLAIYLANSHHDRGAELYNLDKIVEAVQDYDKTIEILTRLVEQKGRKDLSKKLSLSHFNRCVALARIGKLDIALEDIDKVIDVRRRRFNKSGNPQHESELETSIKLRELIVRTMAKSQNDKE